MPFCPTDHSEIAPPRIRGRLITLFQLAITLGIALGYFVDLGTQNLEGSASWRVPFAIQIVTSVALAAGCLVLPYSPRWLIYYGRDEEGLAALASMRAGGDRTDVDVVREYGEIRAEIKLEREMAETSWIELVKGTVLKRTLIGVFIQTFQQFTGINGVLYFAPVIFAQAGLDSYTTSLIATGVTGIVNFVFTIPPLLWMDQVGRKYVWNLLQSVILLEFPLMPLRFSPFSRPALVSGAAIQAVAMFTIGGSFAAGSYIDETGAVVISSRAVQWTIVAFIFIFVAGIAIEYDFTFARFTTRLAYTFSVNIRFAYSWGAVGTVYPAGKGTSLTITIGLYSAVESMISAPTPISLLSISAYTMKLEIFPMRLRSKGMSITTGSNWLFNIVVTFVTPVVIAKSTYALYFFFAACCVVMTYLIFYPSHQVVCCFIPETKGRTLEEMEDVFGGVTKHYDIELAYGGDKTEVEA
ncbi:LOW QUALITY PROTEIN: hypothetical protein BC938DRAFT_474112 [Jimgerdemannia flammicorona]|uniref:Major facilitator superfamily (MFS) profile domain-containing protein n=1 Tax=Jimgerdemannia flammicorona TaxID=994334 RepID=A0A433QSW2_9FUNG|nr:LOW QUALITY PROTEIN: hypothetical protein BC938DRAFT_474112 [Jimgerdemannia flammicorona]